jgi:hypothetical protein
VRNRYADTCYRCGGLVGKGQGHFEKVSPQRHPKAWTAGKKWVTQHASCAIEHRGTPAGTNVYPKVEKS